jgi:solute carrier family 35 protein E1
VLALIVTFPIWVWSEGLPMMADYWQDGSIELRERPGSLDHGRLSLEFIFNGTFHFGQSMIAFVLLGMVSPVTYSVASLIKRVAVIIFAIVWFGNPMTKIQGFGFVLTFLGLYLYDRTSDAARADKLARNTAQTTAPLLPLDVKDTRWKDAPAIMASPMSAEDIGRPFAGGSSYANGAPVGSGPGRPMSNHHNSPMKANGVHSLAPGTKAEATWQNGDVGNPRAMIVR